MPSIKTHLWSKQLDSQRRMLTYCGMYLKQPGMRRNEGNTFEIAETPQEATCKLCREAVGLPKTNRPTRYDILMED